MNHAVLPPPTPSDRRGESGMALLLVLGITATLALLAIYMLTLGEQITRESAIHSQQTALRYDVESATDTAFWLHVTDRRLFSNRTVGTPSDDRETYSDLEPWMLDNRAHALTDHSTVYLVDAVKSISVSNIRNLKAVFEQDDTEAQDAAEAFIDVYQDYIDSDDTLNLNGKESDDYLADGFPTLPRNAAMRLRAELYWLDNWQAVLRHEITIIPPKGLSIGSSNSSSTRGNRSSGNTNSVKPNFFACGDSAIRNMLLLNAPDLSDATINGILLAKQDWIEQGVALEDSLDGETMVTLRQFFSFAESGYAEITAVSTALDHAISRQRTVTREVNMSSSSIFSDKAKETLSIWEIR